MLFATETPIAIQFNLHDYGSLALCVGIMGLM